MEPGRKVGLFFCLRFAARAGAAARLRGPHAQNKKPGSRRAFACASPRGDASRA